MKQNLKIQTKTKIPFFNLSGLNVAIVHDYLNVYGGAEGVVEAIYEIFPQADIYTAVFNKKEMQKADVSFLNANIYYPKWKNNLTGKVGSVIHKLLIANLPLYFLTLNLKKYDLIISSTAHFAKGVRKNKNAKHFSYIHTVPKFLYGYPTSERKRDLLFFKILLYPLDFYLKIMDKWFSKFPDYLICNSNEVKNRIKKHWNLNAKVIYPFPNVKLKNKEEGVKGVKPNDFYLMIGRSVRYKNFKLVANILGKQNINIVIAGTGPQSKDLETLDKKYGSVKYLGFISESKKAWLLKNCKSFILATDQEDSGMTVFEPMLYGKPVIAYYSGGFKETVINKQNGIFFKSLSSTSILNALNIFEKTNFNQEFIKNNVKKYSKNRFKKEFLEYVSTNYLK